MAILSGIHPVAEALRAKRPLERILVAQGAGGPRMQEIIDMARRASVPVRFEPRGALDRLAGSAAHQGVVAMGAANKYADFDAAAFLAAGGGARRRGRSAQSRRHYPHGARGRSGRDDHPERRAAGVTDVVAKAAAGALEYLPITRVTNINRALEELKEKGYWIYGLDERGTETYDQADYAAPTAFVLGGEGKGLHEQVRKHCDILVRIPMAGKISSLNVSVAAGVVLFEWKRRA
jgi:23S rRNA (guanosine2251-2'-O)-methyltransferase